MLYLKAKLLELPCCSGKFESTIPLEIGYVSNDYGFWDKRKHVQAGRHFDQIQSIIQVPANLDLHQFQIRLRGTFKVGDDWIAQVYANDTYTMQNIIDWVGSENFYERPVANILHLVLQCWEIFNLHTASITLQIQVNKSYGSAKGISCRNVISYKPFLLIPRSFACYWLGQSHEIVRYSYLAYTPKPWFYSFS